MHPFEEGCVSLLMALNAWICNWTQAGDCHTSVHGKMLLFLVLVLGLEACACWASALPLDGTLGISSVFSRGGVEIVWHSVTQSGLGLSNPIHSASGVLGLQEPVTTPIFLTVCV